MKDKRNYLKEKGITLIALVVTIVVLLILAGVTINAVFSDSGIIKKAQDAQNKANESIQKDMEQINALENWLSENTGENNNDKEVNISTLVGKEAVTKNTKAEDAYGNKITIPKGFKILPHGTEASSATYTYSGDNIPAVQDGIVIENETDGNQFVWVPVGTIKNKNNTTNTITLGRYSDFTMTNGTVASGQPVQVASTSDYFQEVVIDTYYIEQSSSREGTYSKSGVINQNATARNLGDFISTTLKNGGFYMARFEASGPESKIRSKYNEYVLGYTPQPKAAKAARAMYGEIKENNKLVYASDLVNSYAWDTTIVFIQTYSTEENANTYASVNKVASSNVQKTGLSSDKFCNIWDLSGNVNEMTTETSIYYSGVAFQNVRRGGYTGKDYTSIRKYDDTTTNSSIYGFRALLYVK